MLFVQTREESQLALQVDGRVDILLRARLTGSIAALGEQRMHIGSESVARPYGEVKEKWSTGEAKPCWICHVQLPCNPRCRA